MSTNAQALFRQGIEALKAGDKATAHRLLSEAAERVPHNQDIWLWLSDAAENDDQRREYIERALAIDPQSVAGQKAQRKLDRLSAAAASADQPTGPGGGAPEGEPPFPESAASSETSPNIAMSSPSGDPAISDGPPLPGSTTWPGESSWDDLPPWAEPLEQPELDEEAQEEDQPFWKKIFSSPWGWAALVAVVVFAFVLIWAIGLAILGDEPEQIALSAERIVLRFKQAGLEAEDPRPMTPDDYGLAPILCQDNSMRFFIPSLGANAGGRVFVCPSTDEVDELKLFYAEQGQRNPELRSWTFDNDRVLIQLNGGLPQEQAERYGAVLNELSTGEPVVSQPTLDDTIPTNTVPYPFPAPTEPAIEPTPILPEPTQEQPTSPPVPPDPENGEIVAPTLTRDTPVPEPTATNPPPPPPVIEPTAVAPQPVEPTPEPPTSTPELTEPPAPEATATPEPVVLTGTGSQQFDAVSLPSPTSRARLEYSGEGIFRVIAVGVEDGEEILLVETEGPYSGEKLLSGATSYFLNVDAEGEWSMQIEAVGTSDQPLEELTGTGDFVSEFFMPSRSGEVPYTFTHDGLDTFRVVLRCADGETTVLDTEGLVNPDALVPFGDGPCLWIVEADGNWQIIPQA